MNNVLNGNGSWIWRCFGSEVIARLLLDHGPNPCDERQWHRTCLRSSFGTKVMEESQFSLVLFGDIRILSGVSVLVRVWGYGFRDIGCTCNLNHENQLSIL